MSETPFLKINKQTTYNLELKKKFLGPNANLIIVKFMKNENKL